MNPRRASLTRSLALFLVSASLAIVGIACDGCSSTPNVTSSQVDTAGGLACTALQGIPDKYGTAAASVCKELVDELAPYIAQAVDSLGADASASKGDAVLAFVPLTKNGKEIGIVRADIAKFVQSKVDGK